MIRWYDFIAAALMADLMLSVFVNSMMAESFWTNFLGGIVLMLLYDMWTFYAVWRKVSEERRK